MAARNSPGRRTDRRCSVCRTGTGCSCRTDVIRGGRAGGRYIDDVYDASAPGGRRVHGGARRAGQRRDGGGNVPRDAPQLNKPLLDTSVADWDAVMTTNARGNFVHAREAVRAMIGGGGGAIVNAASIVSAVGMKDSAAYAASKGGHRPAHQGDHRGVGARGIRANAVARGRLAARHQGHHGPAGRHERQPDGRRREHPRRRRRRLAPGGKVLVPARDQWTKESMSAGPSSRPSPASTFIGRSARRSRVSTERVLGSAGVNR